MKTVGIIGGIGPESTAEYHRLILAGHTPRVNVSCAASHPALPTP